MMNDFTCYMTFDRLQQQLISRIKPGKLTGLDHVSYQHFLKNQEQEINTIIKKVINKTYRFTYYRQFLISKGRGKCPRVISVPTYRDKLLLSMLHMYLTGIYKSQLDNELVQTKVEKICSNLTSFDAFVKIDIKGFYSNINHEILLQTLNNKNIDPFVLHLIFKAIKTPTVSMQYSAKAPLLDNDKGVPEGLSISNILANIFLLEIDKEYQLSQDVFYTRYVDDILILCSNADTEKVKKKISAQLDIIGLQTNIEDKDQCGLMENNQIVYLGYAFSIDCVTVRQETVKKLEQSLEKVFRDYLRIEQKNVKALVWKLNLKISGCIYNKRKYGWMFFFSQITDKTLLTHLDWLTKKYAKRFGQAEIVPQLKSFFTTYYEIKFNLNTSKYFINADRLDLSEKQKILTDVYQESYTDATAEKKFNDLLFADLKQIEKDIPETLHKL